MGPPLPLEQRKGPSSVIRLMRGPAEGAQGAATAPAPGIFDEGFVHRTLVSSKQAAHMSSIATLSTDVPGTDSTHTLLSSQKSLPPAPPILPLPPVFAAFRGNPKPPMVGAGSALSLDSRRPPRAPLTAR